MISDQEKKVLDIIYHAVEERKLMMVETLNKDGERLVCIAVTLESGDDGEGYITYPLCKVLSHAELDQLCPPEGAVDVSGRFAVH